MTNSSQTAKSQRIIDAEKRLEQARNALKDARNAENKQKRKIEDRQKIILGGALLKAAEGDERFSNVIDALLKRLSREQDIKAFQDHGFATPRPAQTQGEG
ncbi:mobilization protein [Acetobacter sp. AN02]|uniref:mobilization protein n=1 Tax=Acetobacter sp. AN02 TaxID=2894186 RepID=UPI0024343925|nr:mobilization protein [Acetobacter sp. AN02]MDG6095532.1 mobilization protein [Acetobacter sp. AN02]